jgi:hypothetical protein
MDENTRKAQIMNFIYNALENGWEIKKRDAHSYIFRKKHHNDKTVFMDNYLERFVFTNFHGSLESIG